MMRSAFLAALLGSTLMAAAALAQSADRAEPATAPAAPTASTAPAADSAVADPQETSALPPPMRPLPVGKLIDMDLYNARGEKMGDVDEVWVGPDDRSYVIVTSGGFLDVGEKTFVVPLDELTVRGDRLVATGLTDEDFKGLPEWELRAGFRELDDHETAAVRVAR